MKQPIFLRALLLDLALIVVFAAMGRRSHEEGLTVAGVLTTAGPFLIGYAVAAVLTRLDRDPLSIPRALAAWAPGIALGMVLRRIVFDRGTATSFMVVAFCVTAALLVGWRLVALMVRRGRARPAST